MGKVVQIDERNPLVRSAVLALLRQAFGEFSDVTYDHILLNNRYPPILYGIYENDEIVATNAFIAHSVHRDGRTGIAYQSCMTATRQDQKGKGHFPAIINFAKTDLMRRGSAFIFGFPNHNSGPIFTRKLGFSISNNIPCLLFSLLGLKIGRFHQENLGNMLSESRRVLFDAYVCAEWKLSRQDGAFFQNENLTNYLFGRLVTKSFHGIKLKMLVVGGFEINKPLQWNKFLENSLSKSGASLLRMNVNVEGAVANAATFKRNEKLTEPLICFALNWNVDAKDIEAFGGLKDVF